MEGFKADGWDIALAGIRGWEYRDGTDQVSAAVGANGDVPNRRGEIWRPKTLGVGMFTLGLWLAGTDQAAVQAQYQLVLRACVRPHRLVRFERTLASGLVVHCDAEYAGTVKPTFIAQQGMKAAIDFKVPDGVWRGAAPVTAATVAGAALSQTLTLPALAPSTAAIEDGSFTIYGPITNPKVVETTDGVDGDSFYYNASIASGGSITVNAATWAVTGGGGHVVNQAKVFPGGRRMLTVNPARPGDSPSLQLRGTGGGAATKLSYTAYPTFAC